MLLIRSIPFRRVTGFLHLLFWVIGPTCWGDGAFLFSQPVTPSSPPLEKTLLWKIDGNGLKKPSYLFGTMHMLCREDAWLGEQLQAAIASCDTVYFEIDLDDAKQLFGAFKYLRMKNDTRLSDLLTEEEYDRLEKHFKKKYFLLPLSMLDRFKPLFISALLSEQTMDCPKKDGMEEVIMAEAKKYRKMVKGLETIAFQASLFDSIPYDMQARDLLYYLDSADNYAASSKQLLDVYRQQDLEKIEQLTSSSEPGMKDYMGLLLYDRNKRWITQMKAIMPQGSFVFAVGAGHLPGDQGVINLLRKMGYRVSPLSHTRNRSLQP